MKKLIIVFVLFLSNYVSSQQLEGLKVVKIKYDSIRKTLVENNAKKKKLERLEKERNNEYFKVLIEYKKNHEELPIKINPENLEKSESEVEIMADYPGGIPAFRNDFAKVFYTDGVLVTREKKLRCEILFVVERDGSLSHVTAKTTNESFAAQAILAIYLTEKKWNPAFKNGVPVRARFKMPITMNFE